MKARMAGYIGDIVWSDASNYTGKEYEQHDRRTTGRNPSYSGSNADEQPTVGS